MNTVSMSAQRGLSTLLARPGHFVFLLALLITFSSHTGASRVRPSAVLDPNAQASIASGSVALLNRVTFNKTVVQEHVDQWVVLFCVNWWDRCRGLMEDYKIMAMHYENALASKASSWQSVAVRFGEVNCATDKPLCNENNVQEYPSAQHFLNGKLISQWVPPSDSQSLSQALAEWVHQELAQQQRHASRTASSRSFFTDVASLSMWGSGMRELTTLLSWKNPITAAFGYIVLACVAAVLAYVIAMGLEVRLLTPMSGFVKGAGQEARPSSLLPAMPKPPEPRTIVRETFEL